MLRSELEGHRGHRLSRLTITSFMQATCSSQPTGRTSRCSRSLAGAHTRCCHAHTRLPILPKHTMRSALKHASTVRRGVARVAVARAAGLTAARLVAPTATAAGRVTATAHRTHQHRSFSTAAAPAGTTLVLADHDGGRLLESTSHVVSAARLLGGSEVVVLVLGNASAQSVADAAAAIAGVNKVIFVEDAQFERAIAEGQSTTIADIVKETKSGGRD